MWRKSSYRADSANCVEASGPWVKSSYSAHNGSCVEWSVEWSTSTQSHPGPLVGVRDSKLGDASEVLWFDAGAWKTFVNTLRTG